MSDDIVTRLRKKHGEFRAVIGLNENVVIDTIYSEAADEIERLRSEREFLSRVIDMRQDELITMTQQRDLWKAAAHEC